jgi:hypothetical protein
MIACQGKGMQLFPWQGREDVMGGIFVAIAITLGLLIPRASPAAAPDAATVAVEKRLDRIETQLTSAVSLLSAIKVLADQAGPRLDKQDTHSRPSADVSTIADSSVVACERCGGVEGSCVRAGRGILAHVEGIGTDRIHFARDSQHLGAEKEKGVTKRAAWSGCPVSFHSAEIIR